MARSRAVMNASVTGGIVLVPALLPSNAGTRLHRPQGPGAHASSRHAGQCVRRGLELQAQDVRETAFAGFDDGAGVMRDQSAQHRVGVLGVAQVPGAVQCVQPSHDEAERVPDVVQPRGGFQEIGVSAENGCQAACLRGDALHVRPAAGKGLLTQSRSGTPRDMYALCKAHRRCRRYGTP